MKATVQALFYGFFAGVWMLFPAGCGNGGEGGGQPRQRQAPDFTLSEMSGQKFSLSANRGKVVLMDFWATWCEPCHETIPLFERLHRRYGGQGLLVLGINVDGSPEDVPEYMRSFSMTYPILLDNDFEVMRQYRVRGIPTLFLLDRQGRIRKQWIGYDEELGNLLEPEVLLLLNERVEGGTADPLPAKQGSL